MKSNSDIVSNFLKNKTVQGATPDQIALGRKALSSSAYFNISPKDIRNVDQQKITYQKNAFKKMMQLTQPSLSFTERLISRITHFRPFELLSFMLNIVIFNNLAVLITIGSGIATSLGFILYCYIQRTPVQWPIIILLYAAGYITGQLVSLVTYVIKISTRHK